jgi:hypothetical protein
MKKCRIWSEIDILYCRMTAQVCSGWPVTEEYVCLSVWVGKGKGNTLQEFRRSEGSSFSPITDRRSYVSGSSAGTSYEDPLQESGT